MIDLKDIQENYKKMSLEKLIALAANPQDLELEAIGILQQELLNRNQTKEALSLTEFLINGKKEKRISNMAMSELKQLIKDRLESGEPIENIKIDLKEEGIDIFDIVNSDNKLKEKAFDYILHLKENGNNDDEIDKKLKETLSIDKEDSEMLRVQLRKKGKYNLIFGYTIVIISLLLFFIGLQAGAKITIGLILVFVAGIVAIVKGHEQIKQ